LGITLGIGIFCLYALALARANDVLVSKNKGVELGRGVLFCYSLGSLFGPLILGFLMQYFEIKGFIWFYIVSLAFLILFAINKPNILNKKFKKKPGNMVIFDD
ncbi:TPA: MFS transporter, partial [Campylobacter jejuni]|nr:MFS transporter [Campylobacter jejuni]